MADQIEAQAFQMKVLEKLKASRFQDSLRGIMRLKIIEKLKEKGDIFKIKDRKKKTYPQKLTYSLMNNFLEKQNMKMTQSILTEEMGEDKDMLSDEFILESFPKEKFKFLKEIGEKELENSSLIEIIIMKILESKIEEGEKVEENKDKKNRDFSEEISLEKKLTLIEEYHSRNRIKTNNSETYEKLLREMEKRYKADLEMEISRIREVETNAAKTEEAKKWQLRFEKFRDELEAGFNTRISSLKDREIKMLEAYQIKVKELEDRIHQQRLDIRLKSDQLQRELEYQRMNNDFDKNVNKEKVKELQRKEEDVYKKKREIDNKEKIFEERLEREMEIYRTVTMKEMRQKKLLIETKLSKLNDELERVKGMRVRVDQLAERNKNLELEIGQKNEVELSIINKRK